MELIVHPSRVGGRVKIPGSKSHAIRAALFAALADGESRVRRPPDGLDARVALAAARALGADARQAPAVEGGESGESGEGGDWFIKGVGGYPRPTAPSPTASKAPSAGSATAVFDVENSGTTLYLGLAAAALAPEGALIFDGDEQIRRRGAGPLLDALVRLGADARSLGGPGSAPGACPIRVAGRLRGGAAELACSTSQYLSALMLACPLADGDTRLAVRDVCERPYLEMTARWLDRLGVRHQRAADWSEVVLPGGQRWAGFDLAVPGDWSSAAFPLVAGALAGGAVELEGLDPDDSQGDRRIIEILRAMGASVEWTASAASPSTGVVGGGGGGGADAGARRLSISAPDGLRGLDIDLADSPDALPALAVAGAFARGTTRLVNVAHARRKETDRVAVMARELSRLGARVRERPDGLEIEGGALSGAGVGGHGDHRVVMALAVAGLAAKGPVRVDTAEAAAVTYPGFAEMLAGIGARVEVRS